MVDVRTFCRIPTRAADLASYKYDAKGHRKRLATEYRLTTYSSDLDVSIADSFATKEYLQWQVGDTGPVLTASPPTVFKSKKDVA